MFPTFFLFWLHASELAADIGGTWFCIWYCQNGIQSKVQS